MSSTEAHLTLIATPIVEELPLEPKALEILRSAAAEPSTLILVEEHKTGRTRWLRWGLPRETIDRFRLFNEHSEAKETSGIIVELKAGARAVLMSDGGLPAFCDPGKRLVSACHDAGLRVTASPFPNSIALAIALSGFDHEEFHFAGFLPADSQDRKASLATLARTQPSTLILMDTPYRLQSLLKDLADSPLKGRRLFLGVNLNAPSEALYRGKITEVLKAIGTLNKVEFIVVLEKQNQRNGV